MDRLPVNNNYYDCIAIGFRYDECWASLGLEPHNRRHRHRHRHDRHRRFRSFGFDWLVVRVYRVIPGDYSPIVVLDFECGASVFYGLRTFATASSPGTSGRRFVGKLIGPFRFLVSRIFSTVHLRGNLEKNVLIRGIVLEARDASPGFATIGRFIFSRKGPCRIPTASSRDDSVKRSPRFGTAVCF